jgi:cyclic pyranopterin phosphate synthase
VKIYRFEDIGDELPLLPLAARRALDVAGARLSLMAWKGLSLASRQLVTAQGSGTQVDVALVKEAIVGADPAVEPMTPDDESRLDNRPDALAELLDADRWSSLHVLERFALAHLASRKRARLLEAVDEIVGHGLSHINARGEARMVDVGEKPITHRRAVASAVVRMKPVTARLLVDNAGPKGDVIAAARIAGIHAAKRTPDLIPLCHGIALTSVTVAFDIDAEAGVVRVEASADARDRTGVEMEAMVAASVAALTIYDMLKAVERGICIEQVVLLEKSGGRSGHYKRHDNEGERT